MNIFVMHAMNAVEHLYRRTADEIQPGLEVIEALVQTLDHPERSIALVHVAGTNGKGSVCAMIESVLRASGLNRALHVTAFAFFSRAFSDQWSFDFGEKIKSLYFGRRIRMRLAKVGSASHVFELSTLIAFQFFADEQVDVAIIETGMGGRWDAQCGVSTLFGDHEDWHRSCDFLGDTLEAIAGEKAGIIKSGRPVISAPQEMNVRAVLDAVGEPIRYSDESVGFAWWRLHSAQGRNAGA